MLKKYTFPKERIFAFNDAVFSIAITLLVLEIDLPSISEIKARGIGVSLQYLIPDFIGFFVSFMVIALYWKFYLIYSRYIKDFDNKLLQINILILMFVALLPFSTGFFVDNFDLKIPFSFYCGNLVMLGLFMYIMLRLVLQRGRLQIHPIDAQYLRFRGLLAVLFWLALFVLSFYVGGRYRFGIFLIFIIQGLGKWYYQRKMKKSGAR